MIAAVVDGDLLLELLHGFNTDVLVAAHLDCNSFALPHALVNLQWY